MATHVGPSREWAGGHASGVNEGCAKEALLSNDLPKLPPVVYHLLDAKHASHHMCF